MYPIKYLNALLLPFKSYLDSTILLISALLKVIVFFVSKKCIFINIFFTKYQDFVLFFILCKEKKVKSF